MNIYGYKVLRKKLFVWQKRSWKSHEKKKGTLYHNSKFIVPEV